MPSAVTTVTYNFAIGSNKPELPVVGAEFVKSAIVNRREKKAGSPNDVYRNQILSDLKPRQNRYQQYGPTKRGIQLKDFKRNIKVDRIRSGPYDVPR
jgi:hypothetical protein